MSFSIETFVKHRGALLIKKGREQAAKETEERQKKDAIDAGIQRWKQEVWLRSAQFPSSDES